MEIDWQGVRLDVRCIENERTINTSEDYVSQDIPLSQKSMRLTFSHANEQKDIWKIQGVLVGLCQSEFFILFC